MSVSSIVGTAPPQRIRELLSRSGEELPILHQSCQSVIDCTDDDSSSANDVSEVIMRDQALMAKIIKMANSAIYHVPAPVISTLQAVKIVGFDVIRAIAIGAEFIEAADKRGGSSAILKRLLARALVSATIARELEEASQLPPNPNLFTSTLLYTLGDLVLAHYLPDIYRVVEAAQWNEPDRVHTVEAELFGQSLKGFTGKMAKEWGLPDNITMLIEAQLNLMDKSWDTPSDQLAGLVCSANELGNCLLSPPTLSIRTTLQRLMKWLPPILSIPPKTMKTILAKAFKKGAQFSSVVKIEKSYFIPSGDWDSPNLSDPLRELIYEIWIATNTRKALKNSTKAVQNGEPNTTKNVSHSEIPASTELTWLQDFTLKAQSTSDPNQILQWAAEGLHSAGKFERVVLTLLAPEKGMLEPRTAYGDRVKGLLPRFRCSIRGQHLFANTCRGCVPVKVENLREEMKAGRIPPEFIQRWGDSPCLLGPVFAKAKPVGLMIADKGLSKQPITQADFASFAMALAQVNVNLTRLAR